MPKPLLILLLTTVNLHLAGPIQGKWINFKYAPCSAAGDGVTDDRPALVRAFSELASGDTLIIPPGNYRIVLTRELLFVPAGATLWGQAGKSRFALSTSGGPHEHREFLRPSSDVVIEGITIERSDDFPAVLLPILGDIRKATVRNSQIIGNESRFPNSYCHAIQLGVGTVTDLLLQGIEVKDCSYGLFQANEATGTVDGVIVEKSRFERNVASDLEFNSPNGVMRNITVRECVFHDNRCKTAAAGFAVGFANVKDSRVESCRIENYGSEALHVEDRSTNIRLAGNLIVGGSTVQPNGVIMVISASTKVIIEGNFVDARKNANGPHLILVTAGGKQFANPTEVTVVNNVLINGRATETWYLQPGSGAAPVGNLIIPNNHSGKD